MTYNIQAEDNEIQKLRENAKYNSSDIEGLLNNAIDLIRNEESLNKREQLVTFIQALQNNEVAKESDLSSFGFQEGQNGELQFLKKQKKAGYRLSDAVSPEIISTLKPEDKEDFFSKFNEYRSQNKELAAQFPDSALPDLEKDFDKIVQNNNKNAGPKKDEYYAKLKFLKTLNEETNDKGFASFEKELSQIKAKNGKPLFKQSQIKDIIGGLQNNVSSMVTDPKVSTSELKGYYKSAKENILKKAEVQQETSSTERKTAFDNVIKFGKIGAIGIGALLLDQVLTDGKLTQSSISSIGQAAIGAFVMSRVTGKSFGDTFQQLLPAAIGYGAMSGIFGGKGQEHQQTHDFAQRG